MEVFVVQHTHEAPNGEEDVKLIGVYSSEYAAQDAVARLLEFPGFSGQIVDVIMPQAGQHAPARS